MESTLQKPTELLMPHSKGIVIAFWIFTALFCLEMSPRFSARRRL